MSTQDRMTRLSIATVVIAGLVMAGVMSGVFLDSWLTGGTAGIAFSRGDTSAESAFTPRPNGADLATMSVGITAPNIPTGQLFDQFDKIIVDVEHDGRILVFGESMEVSKFRAMLLDQLTDHAKTIVAIRPDENCLFRHIEQVIQVCDECDIHHQTITNSDTEAPSATLSRAPG
jgi:biopolymer transport protein ExbD